MLLSAPAFAWDDPELTFVDPDLTEDSSGGGEYMIYHVGQGLFCNDGNWTYSWDSQLVIRDSGLVATLTWGQDYELSRHDESESDYNDGYGWRISMFEGNGSTSTSYFCELYLYSGECICTDHNAQGHILWQFESLGDQTYKIKISDTDPTYGTESDYAGNTCWGVDPDDDGVYPLTNVETAGYEDYECEWKFVDPDVYEVYYAKKQLQTQLEAADEAGYTDYSEFSSLYESSSATPDELLEAAEELQAEILEAQYADASSDNPADVTDLIENPYFEDGSSDGWTTYQESDDGNFAYKSSSTEITFADGSTSDTGSGNTDDDGNTWYFWERWYWTTTGDWYVEQDLTGMPRGKYVLSCYAFTNGGDEGAGDGFYLRATVNGAVYEAQGVEVCPEDYSAYASKMELEFSVVAGEATIGFYYEDCEDSYWTGVGGFKLYYYGTEGADSMSDLLQDEIDEAKATYEAYVTAGTAMSNAAVENYEAVIAAAEEAAANSDLSDDELTEQIVAIQNMLSDMEDDIEAYSELYSTIQDLWEEEENSELVEYTDVVADYEDFLSSLEEEYEARTFDVDNLDSVTVWAEEMWKECVISGLANGLMDDATLLIENADFSSSTDGWTVETGSLSVSYECGEVFDSEFDLYQELTGLPAGSYKVTAQAFYRPSGNSTVDSEDSTSSLADYPVLAYLYGNDASVKLHHCYDYYYEEAYDEDNDYSPTVYYGDAVYYVPNNMYSAAYAFELGYYPNEVVCYVTDEGTLKLGINIPDATNILDNCWCIFDNFTLTYLGADDVSGATSALESLIEQAQEYLDSDDLITTEAIEALNAAIEAANAGLSDLDLDTYTTLTAALNDAIDLAIDAEDACADFEDYAWTYIDALTDGDYDDYMGTDEYDAFETLMYDTIEPYLDGDEQLENEEQIDELMVQIAKAYGEMLANGIDVSNASAENPIDVTDYLSAPSFSEYDEDAEEDEATMAGWTSNYDGLQDDCCFEFYNTEDTYIYQTVYALAKGYYTLTYKGFYRAGSSTNAGVIRRDLNEEDSIKAYAYVSIEDDGSYWSEKLASIFECVQEFKYNSSCLVLNDSLFNDDDEYANQLYKVIVNTVAGAVLAFEDGYYDGSLSFYVSEDYLPVEIGIKKDGLITSDWTIFDDFTLTYTGSDMPEGYVDAIEGVEAADDTENVVSTKWYTINGMEVSEPSQRGIYIRLNVLADGTKQVVKVMIP